MTQGIAVAQNKTWKSQVNEHSYENTEVRDDSHIDSREQKHSKYGYCFDYKLDLNI